MNGTHHGWVYDQEDIEYVIQTDYCVCGTTDESLSLLPGEYGGEYLWCPACRRQYTAQNGNAVHPNDILETTHQGLVSHESGFREQLGLLIAMSGYVEDYVEFSPTVHGEVVLYAADNILVGHLIYDTMSDPFLRAFGVAPGHRGNGYGSRFLEEWFETRPDQELEVLASGGTREFYQSLSFTTTFR